MLCTFIQHSQICIHFFIYHIFFDITKIANILSPNQKNNQICFPIKLKKLVTYQYYHKSTKEIFNLLLKYSSTTLTTTLVIENLLVCTKDIEKGPKETMTTSKHHQTTSSSPQSQPTLPHIIYLNYKIQCSFIIYIN